ncbi:Uncharacterized protein TCM_037541 [Theobroma cacao]|uniref:PGG domain-containing protein n=1 Tax=Theobroma cacao TaxID=3641 RepID=A0A061GLK3_THECC|nr:Uncharacterized protein TCM_037541 [Theobroma cacao]
MVERYGQLVHSCCSAYCNGGVCCAITVPGGNNGDNGFPIFSGEKAFIIFAIADALFPFSSTAAIFMFLSILTARYWEADFLYALPKILGLLTLFISITFMMIAFGATVYIVFVTITSGFSFR